LRFLKMDVEKLKRSFFYSSKGKFSLVDHFHELHPAISVFKYRSKSAFDTSIIQLMVFLHCHMKVLFIRDEGRMFN
ncbi:hypothetical protein T06_11616, partial [Trichinella sp. T6]